MHKLGRHFVTIIHHGVKKYTVYRSARRPLPKDLLYVDDLVIVAESEVELQERVVQWQENL